MLKKPKRSILSSMHAPCLPGWRSIGKGTARTKSNVRVLQEASSLAEALQAAQRDALQAAQQAEEAERRIEAAEAAAEQLRGQQAQQSRLSEELRQALSSNQQLASQVEEASSQSSQVQIPIISWCCHQPQPCLIKALLRLVCAIAAHARYVQWRGASLALGC